MMDDASYSSRSIKRSMTFDLGESSDELSISSDSFPCSTPTAVTAFTLQPPSHIFKNASRPVFNEELMRTAPCLPYEFTEDFLDDDEMEDADYERIAPSTRLEPRYSLGFYEDANSTECINALLLPSLATSSSDEEEEGSNCSTVGSLPKFPDSHAQPRTKTMRSPSTTKQYQLANNAEANTFGALAA